MLQWRLLRLFLILVSTNVPHIIELLILIKGSRPRKTGYAKNLWLQRQAYTLIKNL